MRAIVFDNGLRYISDYPEPAPKEGEALVKVRYAGICSTDLEIAKGYMGFRGVLGHEFTGVVVKSPDPSLTGKRVAGEINISCGRCACCAGGLKSHCPERSVLGICGKDGAFADFLTLPSSNLHVLPDGVSDQDGVFAEPLAAAFEIMEQVDVEGKRVCVLGGGRMGILIAQALKSAGCAPVVIGRRADKLSILGGFGIPARLAAEKTEREFDIAIDSTGSESGLEAAVKAVRPRGTVVLKTTIASRGAVDMNRVVIDEITVVGSRCGPFGPAIKALSEKKVAVSPLVSGVYPIEKGVEAVGRASEKGTLKVLIKID